MIHNIPQCLFKKYYLAQNICHRVDIFKLVKSLASSLRFPHSSWINTVLSKFSKFSMSSISIPSGSFYHIFFWRVVLQRDFLWKYHWKNKKNIICERSLLDFISCIFVSLDSRSCWKYCKHSKSNKMIG